MSICTSFSAHDYLYELTGLTGDREVVAALATHIVEL